MSSTPPSWGLGALDSRDRSSCIAGARAGGSDQDGASPSIRGRRDRGEAARGEPRSGDRGWCGDAGRGE
eukprot:CAMPEP_0196793872 /NCGR_PEP_ID=MMETSP1104-20130614/33649_1 /TAXON_ID=33652 /ORGANISM="Cafeteria sp., Strain Caron Lab Isolate" /LENGTH=68 /DNA_ID=CAMNT_0042164245 /DNA_START=53 /DNA_END=256 /DNA_ORIENTATION=-